MPLRSRKEKIFKYPQRNIGELDLRDARNRLAISDVVQPVLVLNTNPVVGARFYKSRANVAAVAAQNQSIAFFGIAVPTFLDRVEVFVSVAGPVRIVAGESITPSAWTQAGLGSDNDMNRVAPVVPRAFIGTNQNFAPSGRIVRRHPSLAINTPWVVDNLNLQSAAAISAAAIKADAVVVEAETVNTTVDVNFEWREIP